MPIQITETRSPSRTGDRAGARRADDPFLAACAGYRAELLTAAGASRRGRLRGHDRDLLQQALVLSYLVDQCSTDAEAGETLREFGQRPDAVGAAARRLRIEMLDQSSSRQPGREAAGIRA
jgi:hypothetical protein